MLKTLVTSAAVSALMLSGAMAQGPTRRARGEAFAKYVNEQMGAKHAIQVVSECGHNDRCIFTTDAVFPVIFPKINLN